MSLKRKTLLILVAAAAVALAFGEPEVIKWLGKPAYGVLNTTPNPDIANWQPSVEMHYNDAVEIGLRADGIVVWRIKTNTPAQNKQ